MTLTRRATTGLLASVAVSSSLVGCTAKEPLRVWAMGVEGEALGPFAREFERSHPGVTIRVQVLPWSAAHEKLLTAFAADNLPDIIALGNTWVSEFAALNALEPLNDRLKGSAIRFDHFFDGARNSVTLGDRILGVPWYVDTRLLFYRTDLLHQAGFDVPAVTWDRWDAQLAALSRDGRHGLLMPINEYEPLVALCLQSDASLLLDDDTRGGFRQAGIRDAFAYAASLYERGYAARLMHSEVTDYYSAFARGEYAFIITGPWNLGEFSRRLPAALQDKWATAPLPGPNGPGASSAGGVSMCVTRASRDKDLAFSFVEYMCNTQQQAEFYKATGDLPPDRDAWPMAQLMEDERTHAFFDQLTMARPVPKVPEWERIANEMTGALERVIRGQVGLDTALERLDAFAWNVLAKRRTLLARQRSFQKSGAA
ncbi:bacterial extracellular solute-binding family protein [Asticcacaulis biprosthecium C19]|uniref:Bacterial extracellular solute-binding family protein n=1 Tax=Asticcacaulis biprosthecium C19 TaxID=715226 RepID=F4QID8_9CAUL|nr:sugar ABC transporter substrate-binding protein [Asticcacaulis biprosthecium]EGF91776.1 bacterial extracellular solute-binding family protein [Asticcacaulis biprosthecium C19]